MFKVECPGCQAPYQVDERRVPAAGLRMRCPKCGNTFPVTKPGEGTPTAMLGDVAPAGRPAPPRRGGALKGTMIGMAAQSDAPKPPPLRRDKTADAVPPPTASSDSDDDLPAVLSGSRGDLPAAKGPPRPPPRPTAKGMDDALPAVRRTGAPARKAEPPARADLPARAAGAPAAKAPAAKAPAVPPAGERAELPSPVAATAARDVFDSLPAVKVPSGAPEEFEMESLPPLSDPAPDSLDLPSPVRDFGSDLGGGGLALDGGAFGEIDLPAVSDHGAPGGGVDPFGLDAPLATGVTALPSARPSSLPPSNPFEDPFSLPELDAPSANEPRSKSFSASFPGFDTDAPPNAPSLPPHDSGASFGAFDGLDDSLTSGSGIDSLPPPPASVGKAEKAGAQYGEVDLGGGDDLDDLDGGSGARLDTDDGMEFGAIPQEEEASLAAAAAPAAQTGAAPAAAAVPSRAPVARPPVTPPAPKSKRGLIVTAAVAVVVGVGGGALALVPSVGPYGFHFFADLVNAGRHEQLLRRLQTEFEQARAKDTSKDSALVIERIADAHRDAPRFLPLSAYLAFARYAHVLRFGEDSDAQARAKVLLDAVRGEDADVVELRMARALEQAVTGQLEPARKQLTALAKARPKSVELWTSLGELELRAGDAAAAEAAFRHAEEQSASPWTSFGLARSAFALGQPDTARAAADSVLERDPTHAGARLLLAELAWQRKDEAAALAHVEPVLADPKVSSADRLLGQVLLGDIHLGRGRLSKAEAAYEAALALEPKDYRALCGLGDAYFEAGRYTAALARYEAALTTDAERVPAQLGVARAKLHLDKAREAREALTALLQKNPKHAKVALWLGRALEKDGDRAGAEKAYRVAIDAGGVSDEAALAYVALAQLLRQGGQLEEAASLLTQALQKLPDSAPLHRGLGEVALSQGRYEQALGEFNAARKLDPADVGVLFSIGVCHRKLNQFEEASRVFSEVAKLDPELPGLPLERGLLLEQSGRTEEALREYESALAKAPEDADLMLRVGCARVAARDGAGARPLLQKVVEKRSHSAEAHHCLGRAYFLEEKFLEALQSLQRATELDPNRAEYFVYVAWVANAAGQVALAQQAIDVALSKDQGLGDAYWQKGVLLLRQGAALDALQAFDKALELRPSRYEVHADRAQAYYQLGREVEALSEWQKALKQDESNATWHFRYGKLLAARRMNREALPHLLRAIELAEAREPKPPWLWQVYQLAATTTGPTAAALPHWRKFLELSPEDSPYRDDAKQALARAGQAWTGP